MIKNSAEQLLVYGSLVEQHQGGSMWLTTSFSTLFKNLCGFLTVSRATRNRNIFSVNQSFPELSVSGWYT